MKLILTYLIPLLIFSCGVNNSSLSDADPAATNPQFDSMYLMRAGERAVKAWYKIFGETNRKLEANGSPFHYQLIDARNPILYPNGGPFQPPSPATRAIVKIWNNGHKEPVALILENIGYFELKAMNGGHLFTIQYHQEGISYKDVYFGQLGSVNRNTSGLGFNYVYYIRGQGNAVTPAQFDAQVLQWLQASLRHIP